MLKNKASVLHILSLDPGITLLALLSVISARVSDEFLSSCLVRKCQNQQVDRNENSYYQDPDQFPDLFSRFVCNYYIFSIEL